MSNPSTEAACLQFDFHGGVKTGRYYAYAVAAGTVTRALLNGVIINPLCLDCNCTSVFKFQNCTFCVELHVKYISASTRRLLSTVWCNCGAPRTSLNSDFSHRC